MKRKSIMFAGMTIYEASRSLLQQLQELYDEREAANIADWVMEHVTGLKKIDRAFNRQMQMDTHTTARLERYARELGNHRPVQYVLGEAWFFGMKFFVNEDVLIPRPETEELVQWIIDDIKERGSVATEKPAILDIGTGSGCIPVALSRLIKNAVVFSCDASAEALSVARKNAEQLNADITFILQDILDEREWKNLPHADIIVSNPPYIPSKEKVTMNRNVVAFEPHRALFVDDNDPVVFYRAIAAIGKSILNEGGRVYVEIHESHAQVVMALFTGYGYASVEVKKDMQGKSRMIRALL